jgi:hypothetical protein
MRPGHDLGKRASAAHREPFLRERMRSEFGNEPINLDVRDHRKISTKRIRSALGVSGTSRAHMYRMLRKRGLPDHNGATEKRDRPLGRKWRISMNTLKLAFVAAGLLVAAPAFAQTAGGTQNTGPQGTGNFVAGKPEGSGNFVAGKPEGNGNFVAGKPEGNGNFVAGKPKDPAK